MDDRNIQDTTWRIGISGVDECPLCACCLGPHMKRRRRRVAGNPLHIRLVDEGEISLIEFEVDRFAMNLLKAESFEWRQLKRFESLHPLNETLKEPI